MFSSFSITFTLSVVTIMRHFDFFVEFGRYSPGLIYETISLLLCCRLCRLVDIQKYFQNDDALSKERLTLLPQVDRVVCFHSDNLCYHNINCKNFLTSTGTT